MGGCLAGDPADMRTRAPQQLQQPLVDRRHVREEGVRVEHPTELDDLGQALQGHVPVVRRAVKEAKEGHGCLPVPLPQLGQGRAQGVVHRRGGVRDSDAPRQVSLGLNRGGETPKCEEKFKGNVFVLNIFCLL